LVAISADGRLPRVRELSACNLQAHDPTKDERRIPHDR
jgi:hypothetical protein